MYQQYMYSAQASINQLSSDELKELLYDDDKLEVLVSKSLLPLESSKQTILDENSKLAEENLTREPELAKLKYRIGDLSQRGKDLCTRVQELLSDSKSKTSTLSQGDALALLQAAAAESEDKSETIIKQLMEKELLVEGFLEQFLASRREMHLRKVKSEKLVELARQNRQSASFGTPNRPYSGFYPAGGSPSMPPYPPNFSSGQVPYPKGPMLNMPMPGQFSAYTRP